MRSPLSCHLFVTWATLPTAKLQEQGSAGTQRMLDLAQEWDRHRLPLVEAQTSKEDLLNKVFPAHRVSAVVVLCTLASPSRRATVVASF